MKLFTHSQTFKVLTTFNHAGGSLNICKGQHQEYPNNPVFSIFLLWAACWAHIMCHHELRYPYTQYWFRWTNISERYAPFDLTWDGVIKPITFIPLFPIFQYCHDTFELLHTFTFERCPRSSTAVKPAKYECDKKNQIFAMSYNIWGPDMISRGPNIIDRGPNIIISTPT